MTARISRRIKTIDGARWRMCRHVGRRAPWRVGGSPRARGGIAEVARSKNIVGASETLGRRRCKRGIRSAAMRGGNLISRKHEGSTGRTPRKRFVSVWRRNSANPVHCPGKGSGRLSMFAGRLGGRRGRTRRREETSAPSALRAVDAKSLRFIVRPPKDFGTAPAPGFICPASHRAIVAGAERPGGTAPRAPTRPVQPPSERLAGTGRARPSRSRHASVVRASTSTSPPRTTS